MKLEFNSRNSKEIEKKERCTMTKLFIEGRRNGYSPEQCGETMTVKEMIEWLEQFDEDTEIFLKNDGGYTYGNITERSFEEQESDEEEGEDYDF